MPSPNRTPPSPPDAGDDGAPTTKDVLHGILSAVFVALHHRLKGKAKLKDIERMAKAVLAEMQAPEDITWEAAEPLTASRIKRMVCVGRLVRIVGRLAELRDPQLVTIPGQAPAEATCAKVTDLHGDAVWSLDIIGDDLIDKLDEVRRSGCPTEFLGVVVAVPANLDPKRPDRDLGVERKDFLLHILDVRRTTSAFDLLAATGEERRDARRLLASLCEQSISPRDYIMGQLIKGLGIVGLEDFPLLRLLLEYAILQAVSCGWLGHAPGRLHLLLIGPPAQGKKLIALAAKLLSAIAVDLASGKSSVAGLVGASSHKDGQWRSDPGLLPRASGGVAVMEDAHTLTPSELRRIGVVLQEVIENGTATSTVAGGQRWEAVTALVIDANRTTQAWAGTDQHEAAILRLRPLLSRIDCIIEIPRDDERAWKVAEGIYSALNSRIGALEEQTWVRQCRLLVAALRDQYPDVACEAVRPKMIRIHQLIRDKNKIPDSGDFAARLAISFTRMVVASARSHARNVATDDDLSCAIKYLKHKVDFLHEHHVQLTERPAGDPIDDFLAKHAGAVVTPGALRDEYETATGHHVDERTMRRHVKAQPHRERGKGRYLLLPEKTP